MWRIQNPNQRGSGKGVVRAGVINASSVSESPT
jgi:hypothetical protein